MDFHHAELHQGREAVEIADIEMFLLVLRILQGADGFMHAGGSMLLEKPLAADAIGRPQKTQGPVNYERLHVWPHGSVVIQQVLFGDFGFWP